MVEILYNIILLRISSQFQVQQHLIKSLKLDMVEVLTPQKLANTTNQPSLPEQVVKHLPARVSAEAAM